MQWLLDEDDSQQSNPSPPSHHPKEPYSRGAMVLPTANFPEDVLERSTSP